MVVHFFMAIAPLVQFGLKVGGNKRSKDETSLNGFYLVDIFLDMLVPMVFISLMLWVEFVFKPVQTQSY